MKILCGIVTYNPNMKRLKENVEAVVNQVDELLIFDNGSLNINEIREISILYGKNKTSVYENSENSGIAFALKYIMEYSVRRSFDWTLSLDQDTVINTELVSKYREYFFVKNLGGLTCNYRDRNTNELEFEECTSLEEIQGCITSGFLIKVSAYIDTKGYDEKMFIDGVDFDICNALRKENYVIMRIPYIGFLHELGNSKIKNIMGKKIKVWNHSSFRKYYIFRNAIYVARKYPEFYSMKREVFYRLKDIMKIILFESNKIDKVFKSVKGVRDGFKMEI